MGLRHGDRCRLEKTAVKVTEKGNRYIRWMTSKKKRPVMIPLLPGAARVIDATPADRLHILALVDRRPWDPDNKYLGRAVKKYVREAGLREELHFHDFRGTAATRLYHAGLGLHDIGLLMGWSPETAAKMLEKYAAQISWRVDAILVKLEDFRGEKSA